MQEKTCLASFIQVLPLIFTQYGNGAIIIIITLLHAIVVHQPVWTSYVDVNYRLQDGCLAQTCLLYRYTDVINYWHEL